LLGYVNTIETIEEFVDIIDYVEEPQSFQEVVGNPHWIVRMEQEYGSIAYNGTWTLMDLPHGC
jgi:hypothetical protein